MSKIEHVFTCNMGIEFTIDKLPTRPLHSNSYLCLFPSIGLKECGKYEHELKELYELYPHADYYNQYASTGQRGTPGEYKRFPPAAGTSQPGILNLYVKVYPGIKAYPNDNSFLRIKNFTSIFKSLAEVQGISELHLDIPSKVHSERQEYMVCLEDYITTCKLHGNEPIVYIHGTEIKRKEQVISRPKIRITTRPQDAPAVATGAPQVPAQYKLEYDEDNFNNILLYEVDFMKIATEGMGEGNGVLKYFPAGWDRIIDDTKLIQEAIKVDEKLKGVIGRDDVFPVSDDIFNAFAYLKEQPKVVILGQDPYHAPGQAHGLSFSVKEGVKIPPSLRNIYNALENDEDVEFTRPTSGCLTHWAEQGVIMLNAALTVEQKKPKSHLGIWTPFTDRLIQLISIKYPGLVFVLWGNDAKKKKSLITGTSHCVLEFNHPSPAMPNNTFGTQCKHFGQINKFLEKKGNTPIDWNL